MDEKILKNSDFPLNVLVTWEAAEKVQIEEAFLLDLQIVWVETVRSFQQKNKKQLSDFSEG